MDAYQKLVRDVMVEDVQSVAPEDTLRDALETMLEMGLTTLPVLDEHRRCVGVIAAVDMLPASEALDDTLQRLTHTSAEETRYIADAVPLRGLAAHRVEDFMSTAVVSVGPDLPLPEAAAVMLQNQIHHLVVLDVEERVIGILSTMDILAAFAARVRREGAES